MSNRTLADDFALSLEGQTKNRGLVRRLLDGTLRPSEREDLRKAEQIAALEEEGHQYPMIAHELGTSVEWLRRWTQTEKYRVLRTHLAQRALIVDDVQAFQRRQQERKRFDANGVKALDYYDQAFKRHGNDVREKRGEKMVLVHRRGDFVDLDRAERAANLFAKAAGWTEPIPNTAKPRTLAPGVIQQQMTAMIATDRKETVVRVTVGDATVEIGSRETAALGGES